MEKKIHKWCEKKSKKDEIKSVYRMMGWKIFSFLHGFERISPRISRELLKIFFFVGKKIKKIIHSKQKFDISIKTPSRVEILQYKNKRGRSRIVVYTAISSGYDKLLPPEILNNNIDYVCFSDFHLDGFGIWDIRPIPYYHPDPVRMARFVKTHPSLLLKEYDIAIWIDANVIIRCNFEKYIDKFIKSNCNLGFVPHPLRDCVFDEAKACIVLFKEDPWIIQRQIEYYVSIGIPNHAGMYETNFFIAKIKNGFTDVFFRNWWSEIQKFSRRDQLGIIPALRKLPGEVYNLFKNGECLRNVRDFGLIPHGNKAEIKNELNLKEVSGYEESFFIAENYYKNGEMVDCVKNKSIDIIICVYNAFECVKKCIESIEENLERNQKIIIVNDSSEKDMTEYLFSKFKKCDYAKVIHNENNLGYTKSANIGLKNSSADLAILINSDTIVTKNWANKLLKTAFLSESIGIVGPMSNAASYQSIPFIKKTRRNTAINKIPSGVTIENLNSECEKWFKKVGPAFVPLIHGFCFGIRRDVINEIGYLDEKTFEKYYGEENDYCFRASLAGFDLCVATNTYIYHKKSMSIPESERIVFSKRANNRLREIYGASAIKTACVQMEKHHVLKKIRELSHQFYSDME
ncbi:MAG: glycosyltransferase [Deltaproteobacteria bacterium]|nr:glycosyltransferase [Deltaproteobacteria bacterium]